MAQFKMAVSLKKPAKEISTVFRILCPTVMKIRTRKKAVSKGGISSPSENTEMKKCEAALVVGLGNHNLPGTRHSVGMSVVDHLANRLGATWKYNRQCIGYVAVSHLEGREVVLLKPKLAMNINGRSIGRAFTEFKVSLSNVFLVHDDLDRPLGKYNIKHGGSAGGHKGVKSAINSLRSDIIKRLRFGIGRPADKAQVVDYVLNDFRSSEIPIVQDTVEKCVDVLLEQLKQEPQTKEENKEQQPEQTIRDKS